MQSTLYHSVSKWSLRNPALSMWCESCGQVHARMAELLVARYPDLPVWVHMVYSPVQLVVAMLLMVFGNILLIMLTGTIL